MAYISTTLKPNNASKLSIGSSPAGLPNYSASAKSNLSGVSLVKPAVAAAQSQADKAKITIAGIVNPQSQQTVKPVTSSAPLATAPITSPSKTYSKDTIDGLMSQAQKIQQGVTDLGKSEKTTKGLVAAPTYGGLVSDLSKTSSAGSPLAAQAGKGLIDTVADDSMVNKRNEELKNLRQKYNLEVGNIESDIIPLEFQQGRSQVLGRQFASQEAAAETALANALTQRGQNITGLTSAGNLGTATQGLAQSGLTSAAGLAQPSQAQYGQTVFDPLTGQYTEGGGLPAETMQQYAQLAANGQIASIPASITSNPVLSAQLNAAAKAINPNYTPTTSAAKGASAADLTAQSSGLQAAVNGAEANFKLLIDTARQGGINDSNVPVLNTLNQNLQRGLTSAPAVASFRQLLEDVRMQYATVLGGGSVTDSARAQANAQIPDDISLSALQTVEQSMKAAAQNRIQGINQQVQSLSGQGSNGGTSGGGLTWDSL